MLERWRKFRSWLAFLGLATLVALWLVVGPVWLIFFDDTEEQYRQEMRFCARLDRAWLGDDENESGDYQSGCGVAWEDGNPSFVRVTYNTLGLPETRDCIALIHAIWELAGNKMPVRVTLDGGFGLEVKCSTRAMLATDEWTP